MAEYAIAKAKIFLAVCDGAVGTLLCTLSSSLALRNMNKIMSFNCPFWTLEKDEYYRRTNGRAARRLSSHHNNHRDPSSQDQVVPRLEKRSGAERDGPIPSQM